MRGETGVLAAFGDPAAAARAIRALRERGIRDLHAAMPAPFPEVVRALGKPASFIDWFTISGAVVGLVCGILLTVLTSLDWPLVVGGKPVVSIPGFVVIFFEVTVLVGALTNLVAVSLTSFFGRGEGGFPAGEEFNGDRIGVFAAGGGEEAARVLRECGAIEVRHVG
jgi:hypothetical protein